MKSIRADVIEKVFSEDIKPATENKKSILDTKIREFCRLVQDGIACWSKAGGILVEMKKSDPDIFAKLIDAEPSLTEEILEGFERIGLRQVYAPLLADISPGASALLRCPYEVQEKYSKEPIDVAVEWVIGKISSVKKRVSRLSKKETALVFNDDGTMNNLEQQAFRLRKKHTKFDREKEEGKFTKNVDIGYYSVTIDKDGNISIDKVAKNPMAQPVRVIPIGDGIMKTGIVVFYRVANNS